MKNLASIIIISALASGCASTQKTLPIVNNKVVFPPLNVISDTKYQWDESISEALNIAKLAQPAGVGNDMRDATDGKTVKINRNDSGNRLMEGVIGFASGGVMGAMSSDNLNRINNELVEWKPTIVELVNKETVLVNGQIDFRTVRNLLAGKIRAAINVAYPELKWGPAHTLRQSEFIPRLNQVVDDYDLCIEFRKQSTVLKDNVKNENLRNLSDHYYEGENKVVNLCTLSFNIKVSKETIDGKLALIAQMENGFILADKIAENYDGYVMVPDIYFINSAEKITRDYAYVSKSGKELLFQKPQ